MRHRRVVGLVLMAVTAEMGVALPDRGVYRVDIFDLRGRRVARLLEEVLEPGIYRLTWLGVDASGKRVAPGVYFLRAEGPGVRDTRKLAVIR